MDNFGRWIENFFFKCTEVQTHQYIDHWCGIASISPSESMQWKTISCRRKEGKKGNIVYDVVSISNDVFPISNGVSNLTRVRSLSPFLQHKSSK